MRHALLAALFGVAVLMGASSASGRSQSELDRFEADVRCKGTRCEALVTNTGQRALDWVGFELPTGTAVNTLTGTNRASCTFEGSFGACRWLNAQGLANFPVGKKRTLTFRTNPGIGLGTRFVMCGGGTTNDQFCAEDDVEGPLSDLEIELTAPARARIRGDYSPQARLNYRLKITNHGPSTSPGASVKALHNRLLALWGASDREKMLCRITYHRGSPTRSYIWSCTVFELHPGQTARITLASFTAVPGRLITRAQVTGQNPDPNRLNNRATRRTTVLR